MNTIVRVDLSGLVVWQQTNEAAVRRATQMAGRDGIRSAKVEGSRAIRERKGLKVAAVNDALTVIFPSSKERMIWAVVAKSEAMPVIGYTGTRQTRKGVRVEINKGSPSVIRHAFIATMKSGHVGVFMRVGAPRIMPVQGFRGHARYKGQRRQAIKEAFTTQPAEAFKDALPVAGQAGLVAFEKTFRRVLPIEIAKRSAST